MKHLRLDVADGVATLALNRPQKLNSITVEMMDELAETVAQVSSSDARVVLLTGSGRAFCAGIDLQLLAAAGSQDERSGLQAIIEKWQATLNAIEDMPQVSLAVVNGVAYGAAIELMLCCDFRFASSRASFGMPETKFGILPDLGGIPRLVRSIGVSRTKEIILRARNFGAMEALRLGLVNRVGEPGDVMGQAKSWAEYFAKSPMQALTRAKRLINAAPEQSLHESLRLSLAAQLDLLQSTEFQMTLQAAAESAPPVEHPESQGEP